MHSRRLLPLFALWAAALLALVGAANSGPCEGAAAVACIQWLGLVSAAAEVVGEPQSAPPENPRRNSLHLLGVRGM